MTKTSKKHTVAMIVMAKRINVSYRIPGTVVTFLYVGTTSGNNSSGSLLHSFTQ